MSGLTLGSVDLRLRPPADGRAPAGALILSHGRGADEHDLFPLLDELDPERRLLGLTTGAPLRGIPPGGRHWYIVERVGYPHPETFASSYAALADRLDATLSEHGIDWSRTVLGGFSQGTVMSYAVALGAGRPRPAALLAFSGFIPEVEGWQADLGERAGLPVYIHHGAADQVIGPDFGRRAAERLRAAGLDVEHRESAAGHWLPPESLQPARSLIERALTEADPIQPG